MHGHGPVKRTVTGWLLVYIKGVVFFGHPIKRTIANMSISPSEFVNAVRASLIPRLMQGEIRHTTIETENCVQYTAESIHTDEAVDVKADELNGQTLAKIYWGDYDLEIRVGEEEIVLFMNKACRSTSDAAVFTSLDDLFTCVIQRL